MTTVDHSKLAHLPLGGSTGSAFDDDASSESLGSSIPEVITLNVILPDGTTKTTEVNSSKPMIDLTVQLTAANRLSPANHTLALYHPETGRPIEYKASQMIGSFHVDTVYVVNKKAGKQKTKPQKAPLSTTPPFEITNRLAVNLPKNQKMVLRIKPQSTLAEIFKMICSERNLDPYKHELRHPTQPNMALNMANSLASYRINEITVVSVSDSEGEVITPASTKAQSIYDTHWTYTNSMPRKKADMQHTAPSTGEQAVPSYMPGMTEKKKKKGFLSIFSRKKEGKFTLSEATYNTATTSSQPQSYEPPFISNGNKPQSNVCLRQDTQSRTSTTSVRTSAVPDGTNDTSARMSTISVDGMTSLPKPSRKNRPAPAPPTSRPLSVNTEAPNQGQPVHSRGSSHSSGFDEINISPLESPGSVSGGKMPNSVQTKTSVSTVERVDSTVSNGQAVSHVTSQLTAEEDGVICSSAASTMSRTSSMSTGGDSSLCSLPRNRKKRRAPPPPQGAPKPSSSDGSLKQVSSGGSITSSSSQSPEHSTNTARNASQGDGDRNFDTRELQMAIAEELKKEVSCDSYTSDLAPDSPRIVVSDASGASEEQTRITLERQKSDVAVFVEQMTELTEGVPKDVPDSVSDRYTNQGDNVTMSESLEEDAQRETAAAFSDQSSSDQDTVVQESSSLITVVSHQDPGDNIETQSSTSDGQMEHVSVEYDLSRETNTVSATAPSESVSEVVGERVAANTAVKALDVGSAAEVRPQPTDFISSPPTRMELDAAVSSDKVCEDSSTVSKPILNTKSEDGALQLHSESSPEGSFSNLNIDDVLSDSDGGDDILPGSSEPVQLVKKKIIPEFTLNLEDEEDNDGEEAVKKEDEEEYTEVITGEVTSIIKLEDYQAGLSSDDRTSQDSPQQNIEQYEPVQTDNITRIVVNSEDFREGEWTDTSFGVSQTDGTLVTGTSGFNDEISFDTTDVTYVSPMDTNTTELTNSSPPPESAISSTHSVEEQQPTGHLEAFHQECSFPSDGLHHETSDHLEYVENRMEINDIPSPPGGISLLSIVSEVKSKSDLKQHASPVEFVQEVIETDESTKCQETISETAPTPVQAGTAPPVFKSLRDAYKNKSEEGQVLIIPKPEPFTLPPEASISREAVTHNVPSASAAVVHDSKIPSGESKTKLADLNVQPIIYKKESLAVSRKAPKVTVAELDQKRSAGDEGSPRFWGPRPWSARENSDDVPSVDVKEVLMRSREAVTRSRKLPPTSEIIDLVEKSVHSSPEKDGVLSSLTDVYTPSKSPSHGSGSPKDKCSNISFSPCSEEESQAMMEEKSITMLAYPMERKSIPKQSPEKYSSSTGLDSLGVRSDTNEVQEETRHYNSELGLSEMTTREGEVVEPRPIAQTRPLSMDAIADAKGKKSLQEQYADLQQQFSKWQKQLMDNERLLPTGPVLSNEEKLARLKAEQNYMRLSTPRPFTHRATDPQSFKLRPIIKKPTEPDREDVHSTPEASSAASYSVTARLPSTKLDDQQTVTSGRASWSGGRQSGGSSQPTSPGKGKSRFEPKLDPREELMIAIRNAGGAKMLTKSRSTEND